MGETLTKDTIPSNLEECFEVLKLWADPANLEEFKTGSIAGYHHGLGQNIRNEWGLWWAPDWPEKYNKEETPLHKYFVEMGLHHADDMSGVILKSFQRHLKGEALDVEEQVAYYKEYWAKMEEKK